MRINKKKLKQVKNQKLKNRKINNYWILSNFSYNTISYYTIFDIEAFYCGNITVLKTTQLIHTAYRKFKIFPELQGKLQDSTFLFNLLIYNF